MPVSPAPNATLVPLNATIQVTFSERLNPLSVNATTVQVLAAGVPIGGLQDLRGNTFAGYSWSFTTIELTPPTVVTRLPAANATGVGVGATISVTFSEPVNPATLTPATFTVTGPAGPVTGTVAVTGGNTATFTPSAMLSEFRASYEVRITTGARDLAGNQLVADDVWTFQTLFALPDHWYRITNAFLGAGKSLEIAPGSPACTMATSGAGTGQQWRFQPLANGAYRLSTRWLGSSLKIEGGDGSAACFVTQGAFTGMAWSFVAEAGGRWRMQNNFLGAARSLEAALTTEVPYMALTTAFSGQTPPDATWRRSSPAARAS